MQAAGGAGQVQAAAPAAPAQGLPAEQDPEGLETTTQPSALVAQVTKVVAD
jgi:hypothetical protein